jgi:hypothetical protein
MMAGKNKGGREIRKPKQPKKPKVPQTSGLMTQAVTPKKVG